MANEYLKRTPTSTGNRKVWSLSAWFKRSDVDNISYIFFADRGSNAEGSVMAFSNAERIHHYQWNGSSYDYRKTTNAQIRDPGSWIHYLFTFDSTKPDEDQRQNIFVNGVKYNSLNSTDAVTINFEGFVNSITEHSIGRNANDIEGVAADFFFVDGQALTPDVFGFYKDGNGYISAGSTQATDFRNGQWVPRTPREIKNLINDNGGFGVNGFYLPMNDSSNFGADFHTTPNSIITLKGENLPQPRNGAPETTDAYVSQLRTDPYAANLVLAVPGIVGGASTGYGDYSADIKGSGSNKTLTANGNAGVAVTASYYGSALSFDGSGDYFQISQSSSDFAFETGDFTVETWFKYDATTAYGGIIDFGTTNNSGGFGIFYSSPNVIVRINGISAPQHDISISNTLVPTNQWNHIAVCRKLTTTTVYINGASAGIGTTSSAFNLTQNQPWIGTLNPNVYSSLYNFTGYIQDLRIYKGVAKYKGGFDVPKPYTPVGIATWRAVPDTCKNNFATLNAVKRAYYNSGNRSLSNGNLSATTITTGNSSNFYSSIGVSTGKWYAETYIRTETTAGVGFIGVSGLGRTCNENSLDPGEAVFYYGSQDSTNTRLYTYIGGYNSSTDLLLNRKEYGDPYSTGDFVGIGINANTGEINFYKNGVDQGVAYKFDTQAYPLFFRFEDGASSNTTSYEVNFGQNPTFAGNVSSAGTFTDANGVGLFKYQPPEGYLALCTKNLPEPTIKDPSNYFKTVLWTGKGSTGKKVTGVGFKPDLIWIKNRKNGVANSWHSLSDSVRNARLFPNDSSGEDTFKDVMSFDDDGFTLDYGSYVNTGSGTYVGWCWKAGGPAVFNTDGTIIPKVSVNRDAGFSIATWTGTTKSSQSIGHGLGKKPDFYIWKSRDNSRNWHVAHKGLPAYNYTLYLDTTAPQVDNDKISAEPDSTLIYPASSNVINGLGEDYVGYFWTEVEGFSRFGSYVGNGSADGPFVYCGFKPAWVLIKWATGTDHWFMCDSSRSPVNPITNRLDASDFIEEIETFTSMDFLSDGFKIRTSNGQINTSGGSFIFSAFAESPLKYANAK